MIRLLHTNDLHGSLTAEWIARIQDFRTPGSLYFDSGDAIKTGNLGIPLREEPLWGLLAEADCTASTIGNRETHLSKPAFAAKLKGAKHPIVCANLVDASSRELVLPDHLLLKTEAGEIAVLGVSVPMVTDRMLAKHASAYLWLDPIQAVKDALRRLPGDLVGILLLSHLGYRTDQKIAEACPTLSVILGGHSHTVLEQPTRIGDVWIVQGGSHARFLGVYDWDPAARMLSGGLETLKTPTSRS